MTLNERIAKAKGWVMVEWWEDKGHEPPAYRRGWRHPHGSRRRVLPKNWSGSISDAWELVEEVSAGAGLCVTRLQYDGEDWVCVLGSGKARRADTAPEAICLAWLAIHEKPTDTPDQSP